MSTTILTRMREPAVPVHLLMPLNNQVTAAEDVGRCASFHVVLQEYNRTPTYGRQIITSLSKSQCYYSTLDDTDMNPSSSRDDTSPPGNRNIYAKRRMKPQQPELPNELVRLNERDNRKIRRLLSTLTF